MGRVGLKRSPRARRPRRSGGHGRRPRRAPGCGGAAGSPRRRCSRRRTSRRRRGRWLTAPACRLEGREGYLRADTEAAAAHRRPEPAHLLRTQPRPTLQLRPGMRQTGESPLAHERWRHHPTPTGSVGGAGRREYASREVSR
eukprot:14560756-Alexandrium_andersonii.AAC.1